MQTWFLQPAQQLLNRAVDRGTALCPGEQGGTWPQLALGTSCLQKHRSGRNPEEGRGTSQEGQVSGGASSSKAPDEGFCNFLCITDAFRDLMDSVGLLETRMHVQTHHVLHQRLPRAMYGTPFYPACPYVGDDELSFKILTPRILLTHESPSSTS